MKHRRLVSSFTASSLIHLGLIPVAALMMHTKPIKPAAVPIELVDVPVVEQPKKVEVEPPPPPKPKRKRQITAPQLISKPMFETKPLPPVGNTKEEVKESEPAVEPPPPLASLPETPGSIKGGWNNAPEAGEAEGGSAGAGNLFGEDDVGVVGGSGVEGGGGGKGNSGLGRGTKGDGTGGGGTASGEALSGLARPLGGYQIKPRYPESARRAGAQGVTLLRVRVLENGKVGEVNVEKSAGFRDLDLAAAEAVKKWLFEPARRDKEPVSVWVMLPVKFELQ
jgi:periplasmic protein TonB